MHSDFSGRYLLITMLILKVMYHLVILIIMSYKLSTWFRFSHIKIVTFTDFDWRQDIKELKRDRAKFRTAIGCGMKFGFVWLYWSQEKICSLIQLIWLTRIGECFIYFFFLNRENYKGEMGEIFYFSNYIFIENLARKMRKFYGKC